MSEGTRWTGGIAGVRNVGTAAQMPTAAAYLYDMPYYATDTGQYFICAEVAIGVGVNAQNTYAWILQPGASSPAQLAAWASQLAWFINASTGNDANTGATALLPIKTWAEFRRRILAAGGFARSLGNVTVTLQTTLPGTDPVDQRGITPPSGTAVLVTTSGNAVLFSGTISAFAAKNPATNAAALLTDASLPVSWTASGLVSMRGRITSAGARLGTYFTVLKDVGGKQARISDPTLSAALAFPYLYYNVTFPTLQVGDTYVIESLTTVDAVIVDSPASQGLNGDGTLVRWINKDLGVVEGQPNNDAAPGTPVAFVGCALANAVTAYDIYIGCRFANYYTSTPSSADHQGSAGVSGCFFAPVGGIFALGNFVLQAGTLSLDFGSIAEAYFGDVGVFDSVAQGVTLSDSAVLLLAATSNCHLYGAGNATFGATTDNGAKIVYPLAILPTVTGTSGNLQVSGVTKTWATAPYLDATTGSGAIVNNASNRAQGTFAANGATPVPVAVASIQASDQVALMRTAYGGTAGPDPAITITAGVGFSAVSQALDLSTFAYKLIKG